MHLKRKRLLNNFALYASLTFFAISLQDSTENHPEKRDVSVDQHQILYIRIIQKRRHG